MKNEFKNLETIEGFAKHEETPFERAESFADHMALSCTLLHSLQVLLEGEDDDVSSEEEIDLAIANLANAFEVMFGISA